MPDDVCDRLGQPQNQPSGGKRLAADTRGLSEGELATVIRFL